jgi:hypothetical protein
LKIRLFQVNNKKNKILSEKSTKREFSWKIRILKRKRIEISTKTYFFAQRPVG